MKPLCKNAGYTTKSIARHHLFIVLAMLISTAVPAVAAKLTAAEILEKTAVNLRSYGAFEASFSLVAGNYRPAQGSIVADGKRFRIVTPDMTIWFDGKTQWTYQAQIAEVSISEPTPDELAQINPFAVVESFSKNVKARRLQAAAGKLSVEITPPLSTGLTAVRIVVNENNFQLTNITVVQDGGFTTDIHIKSLRKVKTPSASTFKFNKKEFPLAEIVDLR